jgi:hypothetical protein
VVADFPAEKIDRRGFSAARPTGYDDSSPVMVSIAFFVHRQIF